MTYGRIQPIRSPTNGTFQDSNVLTLRLYLTKYQSPEVMTNTTPRRPPILILHIRVD